MSGKGSAPRPFGVDADTFASNWDAIKWNTEGQGESHPKEAEHGSDKEPGGQAD